jgi:hypothetical protein
MGVGRGETPPMGWENNQNTLPAAGREEELGHVGEEAGEEEEGVGKV